MLEARLLCSIWLRTMLARLIFASTTSEAAIETRIRTIRGAMKSGRRAMSAKVSRRETKTPRKRAGNDWGAGDSAAATGGAEVPIGKSSWSGLLALLIA